MTNSFYNHGTTPATGSSGSSALVRAEFDAVTAGFALMPQFGGAGFVWRTNASNNGGESVSLATLINGAYLPIAGGTMTGDLNMGAHQVVGVTNIGGSSDAGAYSVWGGLTTLNGGTLQVFGNSNVTAPGSVRLLTNGTSRLIIDFAGNSVFTGPLAASQGITTTTSGSSNGLTVTDTGANGSNIRLIGNGATTPTKSIRATAGTFQVVNDAYSVAILSLTDAGALTVSAGITGSTGNFSGGVTISAGGASITGGAVVDTLTLNTLGAVTSGTYTPTLTNTQNVAASTTRVLQYMRVGKVVTVSGNIDIDPTSAGGAATNLGMSLPIASTLAGGTNQLGGAGIDSSSTNLWQVLGDVANSRALFSTAANNNANQTVTFSFTYLIV